MKKMVSITTAAAISALSVAGCFPTVYAEETADYQPETANVLFAESIPDSIPLLDDESADYIFHDSFEGGENGWGGRASETVASSTKAAYQGSGSLYVSGRSDSWNGPIKSLGSEFAAGETYSFSCNVMYETGSADDLFHFTMQYDAGGETHYDKIASATIPKDEWGQLANKEFRIPDGAENISIYAETDTSKVSFYIDEVIAAKAGTEIKGAVPRTLLLGDVNFDGQVDALDVAMARDGLINEFSDKLTKSAADVDKSTEFEINDLVLIQEFALGKTTEFPDNAPELPPEPVSAFEYNPAVSYHAAPNDYLGNCSQKGTVHKETYNSINGNKTLYVYTPYNYDPEKKYNIFYIMHGGGENENTVFGTDVELDNILDHMIMNGDLEPMIVVTPTFNGGNCSAQNFYQEFRANVVPFVEGKYSTYAESTDAAGIEASRMHRAYGGFSMGGVSTWAVMQNCLDMVGYFMPLSGDHWDGNSAQEKAQSIGNAINKAGLTPRDYFIFAATGSDDIAYPNISPQVEAMKPMSQFVYTSDFSQGNFYFLVAPGLTHWWGYVRHYVYDALPYFFHENQ